MYLLQVKDLMLLVPHIYQCLIIEITIVHVHGLECEVIETPLADEPASGEEHVAVLLYLIVLHCTLDLIAILFDVGPAPLHIQCAVEGKFLVDHSIRVIRPHMVEAVSCQPRSPIVEVAVAHVTIGHY